MLVKLSIRSPDADIPSDNSLQRAVQAHFSTSYLARNRSAIAQIQSC
ncbi:hypothetical protein [Tychonema sp. LEGE 07203]|nr:hypothetical protein [Tychonema sp. LEGE 07203]MBE9097406.1 hypothetical protein [Tychonema sp. LEGE 07203]